MTPDEHRRAKELFQRAQDLPPEECEAFVRQAEASDEVRAVVRRLLRAAGETPEEFLSPGATARPLEPAVVAGQRLGPYEVLAPLGAGAMGEVWRARDTRLGRDVAVKLLPPALASSAELRARFEREARAVAALSHPNILALYDVGRAGRVAFVVTELLEGETLRARLAQGAAPAAEAVRIAAAVARGLAAAHAKGIVHRDLKPENVFLTADGQVKLLDFGIAEGPGEGGGMLLGTPGYGAPEQARGDTADARADLFALGCVLYEMLAGRRAFAADTVADTLAAVQEDEPPPLANVPPALQRVVQRCLEKGPARRYASAREVEKAVEDALASSARLMLAVLPFESIGSDPEQERFADGMTEEMITVLGRAGPRRLGVIARASAMQFKGRRQPVDVIGRALGVDHVIEGSVRRQGGQVRIAAQLIQVSDQALLWSDSFDGRLADILALQADVARRIAGALSVELQPRFRGRPRAVDPRAYDAYLAGRSRFYQASEQGWRAALDFYREAVALDPSFALAHAAIASGSTVWALWGTTPPSEARATATAALAHAQELEPGLAEVHVTLALVRLFLEWDWARAEEEFRRAIALNPSDGEVYHWYAHYLLFTGRPEEGLDAMAEARRFDPLSTFHRECLAGHLVATGDVDRAEPLLRDVLQQRPGSPLALHFQGWLHERAGRIGDAVASWEAAARASDIPNLVATVGYGYALAGRRADALAVSEELARRAGRRYVAAQDRAKVFAGLGERDQAFEWMEEAFRRREAWLAALPLEPGFDALRSDPRFGGLMRRIGLAT